MFIKSILLFCTLIIGFAHGAADNKAITLIGTESQATKSSNADKLERCDLIGLSVSPRGKHAMLAPEMKQGARERIITFVYSEHPAFKANDTISRIAQKIAENIDPKRTGLHTCDQEIIEAITDVLGGKPDPKFLKEELINLLAFQIVLNETYVNHVGLKIEPDGDGYQFLNSAPFRVKSVNEGLLPTSYRCSSHYGIESYAPLQGSIQDVADSAQAKNPEKPFNLFIHLGEWLREIEKPIAPNKPIKKPASCEIS